MSILLDNRPASTQDVISLARRKYMPYANKDPSFNLAVYEIRKNAEHTVHILPVGD